MAVATIAPSRRATAGESALIRRRRLPAALGRSGGQVVAGRAVVMDWRAAQFRRRAIALPSMPIRLDKLVAERFALSRRAAQDAVRNGRVDVAGERCDEPGREVEPDADVAFFPNRPKARKVAGRLRILHEDRHVVIVDKPAGLLTLPTPRARARHPARPRRRATSPSATAAGPTRGSSTGSTGTRRGPWPSPSRPRPSARSRTSSRPTTSSGNTWPSSRGVMPRESGTIDLALVTDRGDLRRGVARRAGEGRRAVTHYRVVERFGPVATLVACWLETGRTHQIRIHLAEHGASGRRRPRLSPQGTAPLQGDSSTARPCTPRRSGSSTR